MICHFSFANSTWKCNTGGFGMLMAGLVLFTPGFRDCVETRFAAVPPDVRKGCALPARVDGIRGYAPTQGRSPGMIRVLPPVGRSHHRTSGGTAANRSFHTVSYPLPVPYLSTHSAVVLAYALRLRSPSEVALIFCSWLSAMTFTESERRMVCHTKSEPG